MPPSRLPHVANFVSMNPNKRGPVELGILNVGREWVERGGRFSLFYLEPPLDWYATLLDEAGIRYGVVGLASWHTDILRACTTIHPDIVHLHMGRHTMARALRQHGIRVLRTEHSDRQPQRLEQARRLVRWHLQRPLETFLCVSKFIAEQTQRDFLVGPQRTEVVYNGCDLERFQPRPDKKRELRRNLLNADDDERIITVAAHLIPRKQQDLLIASMPAVLATVPRARLVIAGDGPDRDKLMNQAEQLSLGDRVTFLYGENDVAAIYAASDVGALTSSAEGLGGSAIEAQACGLPLIATPVDGLAETFLPEETGIAVSSNVGSVSEAMTRLLSNDQLRLQMGDSAHRFVTERFHPRRQVETTCGVYERIGR